MRTLTSDAPPLGCEEVVRSLWEYLDGRAGPERMAAIEAHLERCEQCLAHAAFEEKLVRTLAALRRRHSDPQRLRESVMAVLEAAGMDGPEH